ncbi:MAG TPA: NAD(P)H-dependent oxidoreductase subunit E [Kiritimatiellia bacterium]|jgi:NADH-quinone oxidoreductase subunit F|nr:NAD(P)H-dependent oxidoreductase subunit E [Kiritimatiellia bacterium]HOR96963.1 NAD(P)H-dependent oxidoreductase subunit E [Kiritimatiellia bacterium]HPK36820.1 NAD(P)H-dependent oxidoreductase subunit E [Kiritimatiellia bacterium]HPW74796.1 NAD(P)H-dependent oxidoreductase subunit E [Kiritimatiellia bacterium]
MGEGRERMRVSANRKPGELIAALQAVQDACGYVPPEELARIAVTMGVSEAELTGVVTFYDQFRLRPVGRHRIRVCVGTACHVKGAERTVEAFRRALRIPEGSDTDAEGEFTVERVACLGCCMLAVAVQVDGVIYGQVTPARVKAVLRDVRAGETQIRDTADVPHPQTGARVRLCACSSCAAAGAADVLHEIRRVVRTWRLPVGVREVGCTGGSYHAPLMDILLEDGLHFRYGRVRVRDVERILLSHIRPARTAARLQATLRAWTEQLFAGEEDDPPVRFPLSVRDQSDAGYWLCQHRIATEGAGERSSLDWDEYCRHGGFEAYRTCARQMTPQEVVAQLEASGLRGRGGGGFGTGRKWRAVADAAQGSDAVVVCNGDEGDPGAFMDRMLLESYPFRVIEGMMIAAHAVGASEGIFYIRHEYPLAVRRVREALALLEREGILGAEVPLRLRVVEGAGAFVCGEETALLSSVEGRRGVPHVRPPYPSESGLFGRPTLVNNVETLALVPWIVRHGAAAFRAVGTAGSPGTKAFALAGKVARGGLVEVPMGLPLRQVVEQIGGGVGEGHRFKAVQVGGPSGGCIPADLSDMPVDYETLTRAGGMMGSGGMVVLDETDCMVDIARYFLSFTQRESCGTCTGCRIGTRRMLEILERLCNGEGRPEDPAALERLAESVRAGSLCGLGRTAPNPVLSTLRHFRAEVEAHVRGVCPARACRALIAYTVSDRCIGCTLCAQNCPAEAIAFTPLERAVILQDRCTKCGSCRQVCPEKAIEIEDAKRDNEIR